MNYAGQNVSSNDFFVKSNCITFNSTRMLNKNIHEKYRGRNENKIYYEIFLAKKRLSISEYDFAARFF